MNIYEMYERNSQAEKEGIWFTIKGGFKFKMKRQGGDNSEYFKVMQNYTKDIDIDTITPEESHSVYLNAFVDAVLIDWEGITDKNGKVIPYSKEEAKKLFTELPELFDIVKNFARERSEFIKTNQDKVVKN